MRTGEKMEDKSYIERLMEFGLTRQEAGIYGCLISEGKTTGYEVASLEYLDPMRIIRLQV